MKVRYSREEMRTEWMRRRWLEPIRADCRISRSDGVDLEAVAESEMRLWFLDQLAGAPPELLKVTDLTLTAKAKRTGDRVTVDLPADTVRVARVRLAGWMRDAEIVADPHGKTARRQENRFSRGGVEHPVAVVAGSRLELYSAESAVAVPGVECLWVIKDPGPEIYEFDERLWGRVAPMWND